MKEEIGEIFLGVWDFVANEKPSPQHTKAYVRNSVIEVRCKIHRSK